MKIRYFQSERRKGWPRRRPQKGAMQAQAMAMREKTMTMGSKVVRMTLAAGNELAQMNTPPRSETMGRSLDVGSDMGGDLCG